MGRDRQKPSGRDPKGHSLRVYANVYDSAAFAALSPHDVLAYLALLREHKGYNNGDLSLPLTRAKKCGIGHPKTLARSLRALCAVGLVAITRKGGCDKGGKRQPNLYRMTDRECFEIPAKFIEAMPETNEWLRVASAEDGRALIEAAENKAKAATVKTQNQGHAVPLTVAPGELVKAKTMARREPWADGLGHVVNMVKKTGNPATARVAAGFSPAHQSARPRAPAIPPLYLYQSMGRTACTDGHGAYQRLGEESVGLFTRLLVAERRAA